ncbi:NADH-quinone oxidoreductase subunit G [Candidatus Frackibacter sp. WG12]|uniref:NADH-dependent [FeFe] hydrogenase, group A6 n=1 Tax=unclassified Candidatus Frackibacter TaxID=2648818 RepID=UPI000798EC4F|nr:MULTISPECIES: NADH-dependent [FeFe] hydrogenase, group A6 [unclassified Candidatus Frackibacter]KXS44483.1 MAG: NADH-quinone oxidoreductase subunit G [Candidatus Frackibacter sp. T328-2]SDC77632.1 NADH-quinone oxidoreductase subunit G [Candidatus Frackibacter sp. WG11]SEM90614.1 NADH-quinone oxidoreductase subunit G [Candidatus Frackibacter sp. WG12]
MKVKINGEELEATAGQTVLEVAKKAGIEIPTLCYLKDKNEIGVCRICMVKVEGGGGGYEPACVLQVSDGLEIETNTPEVRELRRLNLELILANHPQDCLSCERSLNCELQGLSKELGVDGSRFAGKRIEHQLDESTPSLIRDPNKCVKCRRCVSVCNDSQGVKVLFPNNRGFETLIAPFFNKDLDEVACSLCGQCLHACPVAAIKENDAIDNVWEALNDDNQHVVVQIAPAVRVSIGEEFGVEPGTPMTNKLVTACRKLGFDKVFDTDFTADLTIMEEGHELLSRLKEGGPFPLLTSCSPGWIKYVEHFHNDFLPNLSSCKSPQQMFGALAKSYYADIENLSREEITVVSVMPCTAKKFEATREEMMKDGSQDVDLVLTTRELARMLKMTGVDFLNLSGSDFDDPLGISTGAADIFGVTGGVMEAALRTVYEKLTGEELSGLRLTEAKGLTGVREAKIELSNQTIKVAVVSGLGNASKVLEAVKRGEKEYHFIEAMACPGGCVGGGGQPIPTNEEIVMKRGQGLYNINNSKSLRKSHENPVIQELYEEYLEGVGNKKAHQLLHTTYQKRAK